MSERTGRRRDVTATRRRIVEATVALHEEVGPAATTISAVAERAGVQRLTVYRHFPDDGGLVSACAADWRDRHPFPDPADWSGEADVSKRTRAALESLYAYYRRGARMLERVLRDESEVPFLAAEMTPFHGYVREVAGIVSAGRGGGAETRRRVRVLAGHAVRFETWRSLTAEGLPDAAAAALMADLLDAVTGR